MPEIPLLDRAGKPLPPISTKVLLHAVMGYPSDFDSLQSFLVLNFGTPSNSDLVKKVNRDFQKKATGGSIAAEVFGILLQLKAHRPQDASVNKATFLVSRGLENTLLNSGKECPSNIDRVHKFWAEFRPAAHIWAAYRLEDQTPARTESEILTYTTNILNAADQLLSIASALDWKFDTDPWILPSAYPRLPYRIEVPSLDGWMTELLEKYRAPKRPK